MSKSIKKNYILNLIYQLLLIIIPIVTIPYVSRVLLDDGVGIYSYSESIVSYFTLFAVLGSTTYAQREIGKVQNSVEARSRIFWEIFLLRFITSSIALCGYGIYLFFLHDNFVIALIFGLNIINILFDITWFFQGIEEFGKVAILGLIAKLLDFAFVFIFIKHQSDIWLYTLGKCGFTILGNLGLWLLLPKKLCLVNKLNILKHLKIICAMFIPTVAVQVYTILDKSMIGWFTDNSSENGYYEYAEKIIRMSITLISALSAVLIPRVAKAHSEGDTQLVKSIIYKAVNYVWLISIPLVFGFLSVSDVLVPVYLGNNFLKSIKLINIFTPIIIFVGLANIIGVAFLIPINKQNVNIIAVTIAAGINLFLNLILIPKLASIGAAISSVAAEGIGIILQLGYVFKKRLLSPKKFFISSIKYLISSLIMFTVVVLIKIYLFPVKVWSLITLIIIGVICYFLCLLIMRDKFLIEIIDKLKLKLTKDKN